MGNFALAVKNANLLRLTKFAIGAAGTIAAGRRRTANQPTLRRQETGGYGPFDESPILLASN